MTSIGSDIPGALGFTAVACMACVFGAFAVAGLGAAVLCTLSYFSNPDTTVVGEDILVLLGSSLGLAGCAWGMFRAAAKMDERASDCYRL